jgi:hypothetical protein
MNFIFTLRQLIFLQLFFRIFPMASGASLKIASSHQSLQSRGELRHHSALLRVAEFHRMGPKQYICIVFAGYPDDLSKLFEPVAELIEIIVNKIRDVLVAAMGAKRIETLAKLQSYI